MNFWVNIKQIHIEERYDLDINCRSLSLTALFDVCKHHITVGVAILIPLTKLVKYNRVVYPQVWITMDLLKSSSAFIV